MKKTLLLMLLALFSAAGYAQDLDENFETAPPTPAASGVWSLASGNWLVTDNRTQGLPNWEVNPSAFPANSGSQAAYINRENTGPGVYAEEWLITPQRNISANRQLRFFTTQTFAGDTGTLYRVMVSSDADQSNLAAYTLLEEYTETALSTLTATQLDYEEKIINLGFTGNTYFAFVKVFTQPGPATSGDRWLIDDVKIVERCPDPTTLGVTNVTTGGATLTWVATATSFNVEYGPSGFTLGDGTFISGVIGNSYNATGLDADTAYQFYITAVCDASSGEPTGPFNFTTAPLGSTCDGPIVVTPLPYFDAGDTLQQGNNISFPSPGTSCGVTGNYLAGNDVVYAYTVPATTTGLISIDMNPLGSSNTGVFVYDDCADIGSNCIAGVGNGNSGVRSIPALAVQSGDVIYIVVSSTNATPNFTYTLSIQDVTCAPPTTLSATGTGPNSANLSWQNPGGATSWEVFVQTAGSSIPTTAGTTANTNTNFGVTQLTAEGTTLQLGTPYQYWVRADCGDGTFSQWSGPYLFNTTSCASGCNYNFEMTDTFGDGWNGNTMDIIQDGLTIQTITLANGLGPETVSVPLCDGAFTIFWNAGGDFPGEVGLTVTNSFGQVIFVKEPGDFSQNSQIFSGIVDCGNPLCLPPTGLAVSNIVTDGATLSWIPNGPAPASWDIYVVEAGSPAPDALATPTANTNQNPFDISGLDPDTQYEFYVRAVCDTPGANPWSEVSAPFTTLPTCPRPTALMTMNANLTSIDFDWTPGLSETAWQYIVLPAGSPAPADNDPNWIDTPVHPVTINTGLNPATAYDFYVRAVCSPDDISTPAGPITGNTTICDAADQCNYTFNLTDSFGDGWNGNTMSVLQNGIVVATLGANFTEGNGPIAVQVALCHGVNFQLFWNTGGAFAGEVGVSITDPFAAVIYTKAPGVGQQGTTLFSSTAQCEVPTCLAPTNVLVTSTGLTTATFAWTENNVPAGTSWDILVLPASAPPPAQNATGWINANSNPFDYTGLDAATPYTVYVRTVCSATDSSFWSNGTNFSTQLCEPSNLCDYTFVLTDSFGDGWNGNTMNILQNGIVVATIGSEFTNGTGPVEIEVSLCNNLPFELFWNTGGAFAAEVGVSIINASETTIYTHAPGTNQQGTSLFTGTVSCIPATCPKPVQLYVQNITTASAEIGWTEAGTATAWEYFVLPAGSPAPLPTQAGTPTTTNPTSVTLTSGTAYVFYVRAICSSTDVSNWSGPKAFATLITNDECDAAIVVPVNPDQSCAQTVSGTIIGATASALPNDCFGTADDDVWFQFTATASNHNINITNVQGSTQDLFHSVYSGDSCGNLSLEYCSDANESIANGLTIGQTYWIRIFSWTATPGQTSTFDICIGTLPPTVLSNTTQYTNVQLIEDILLNSTCANVSNISSSTGIDFGSTNGIGYFERNGSSFPFDYGIVLTSGNAANVSGPNTDVLSDGSDDWGGDSDLTQVLTDQGITGPLMNATVLEFDFVPLTNNISFDFIFASEEYGGFQCNFSDVFAFLLTDTQTGITTNLAVVPGTNTPISVTTIRDSQYNGGCGSVNEQYFGAYYDAPEGNPLDAPINFNGMTVPLTATSPVVAGQTYHIKLAVADFGGFGFEDTILDSAVFLKGGSFGIGNLELGENLLQATGNAVCAGDSVVINSTLDPANYTFNWFLDNDPNPIPNENGATLTVTQPGTYLVEATFNNSSCVGTDTVVVEYYAPVVPGQADNLVVCNSQATDMFNLTNNQNAILAPLGGNFVLDYYLTAEDAALGDVSLAIPTPAAYTNISNPQTIYVRATNNVTGCFGVTTFQLLLQDLTPQFTLPADFSICQGSSATIAITPLNFDLSEATYSWTVDTNPLPDTSSSITISAAGYYEVTVNRAGCTATLGVNVGIDTQVVPTFNTIANVCVGATAPALPDTSLNAVPGSWNPSTIDTTTTGTFTFAFTPDLTVSPCAVPTTITVTVDPSVTPTFAPLADVCVGGTVVLPVVSTEGYTGTWSPMTVDTSTAGTFTFCFTPDAGQGCLLDTCLTINVIQPATPVFASLPSVVCVGTTPPVLPLLSDDNFTGSWSPSVIDNTLSGSYTFTPSSGQCASAFTFSVTVLPATAAVFAQVGPVCQGDPFVLPSADGNGITGSWSPAADSQSTTTYTFTPDAGQCATGTTMTVVVNPTVVPVFAPFGAVCLDSPAPAFPAEIGQGLSGSWSPSSIGTGSVGTTAYTFTPDPALYPCAATGQITVEVLAPPSVNLDGACDGSQFVITATGDFGSGPVFSWTDPSGAALASGGPSAVASQTGTYDLTVTGGGCSYTSSFTVLSLCTLQRGISPGDGGKNNFFDLAGQNVRRLEIFNRYGTKVYDRVNYSNEWQGQSDKGDELPDGTYYYMIEYATQASKTGWIYINRVK